MSKTTRREHDRLPSETLGRLRNDEGWEVSCRVENVSDGGLGISAVMPARPGERLTLQLGGEKAAAIVVRWAAVRSHSPFRHTLHLGARFADEIRSPAQPERKESGESIVR